MSYFYMSNINNFTNFNSPDQSYQTVGVYTGQANETLNNGVIKFIDNSGISQKANFIMIRAHQNNDLLLQLYPSIYGVYIPAGELWSAESIDKIEKIYIRKIFDVNNSYSEITSGKIQWMIGYK